MRSYIFLDHKGNQKAIFATEDPEKELQRLSQSMNVTRYEICDPEKTAFEDLKKHTWYLVKKERDKKEQSGLPYMGKVLDSDAISIQRITVAVQAAQAAMSMGVEFNIDWTCQDNTTLTMSAAELMGVPAALAMYSNKLHQRARVLREQIDAATTKEELDAIDWQKLLAEGGESDGEEVAE